MANFTERDFEIMLKKDENNYANLLQIEKILRDHEIAWTKGASISDEDFNKRQALENQYKVLKERYQARQNDYKNNAVYKFGKKISGWVTEFTNKITSSLGLNGIPLAIPVAYVAGAVIVTGAIAYFCGKYFSQTQIDYTESLKVVAETAKLNPELAKDMLKSLNKAKEKENTSFSPLAKGALIVGLGVLVYTQRDKLLSMSIN